MKIGNVKYCNIGLSVLVGIGMFVFWYVAYPHALSYFLVDWRLLP